MIYSSLSPRTYIHIYTSHPGGLVIKNPPDNTGDVRDVSSISGLRRSSGGGNDNSLNSLQYVYKYKYI